MSFLEPDFNIIKGLIEFIMLLSHGDFGSQRSISMLILSISHWAIMEMKNSGNPG